jgi:hypothetical protein
MANGQMTIVSSVSVYKYQIIDDHSQGFENSLSASSLVEDDSLFRWECPCRQFPPGEDGRYYLCYFLVSVVSLSRWECPCRQFPLGEDGRYYLCYFLVSVVPSANTAYRR